MAKSIFDVIDTSNKDLLKEYEGKYIYDADNKLLYSVGGGQFNTVENQDEFLRTQGQSLTSSGLMGTYKEKEGLISGSFQSGQASDFYKYYKPTSYTEAQTATGNFGMGATIAQDQYTGETAGLSSGGATLYKLKDGSVTATPPAGTEKPAFVDMTAQGALNVAQSIGKTESGMIYGTLQELANKGYQVSGNNVYSNGQIIGSYGGVNDQSTTGGTTASGTTTTTPDKSLYIGATNWANLQKQYTPEQLAYATMKVGNDIYWNPERNIEDYGKTTGGTTGTTGAGTTGGTGTGVSGADVLASMGITSKNEADYFTDVMNSSEFKYIQEKLEAKGMSAEANAQAAKDILEQKYASDKTSLEQKLAANGLSFSGIRASQVKGLADSLAASELKIDRELASKILELDYDLMDKVLDMVTEKVQEAKNDKKEAMGYLEDMGLTINPITGELTPTLAAKNAEFSQQMQMANYELSAAKAMKPTVTFETAGGRRLMITYSPTGEILETKDLGSAYKGSGGGAGLSDGSYNLADFTAEELALARAYNAGQSIGNQGTRMGRILVASELLVEEETRNSIMSVANSPEELANNIAQGKANGMSDEQMKTFLQSYGVTNEQITSAFNYLNQSNRTSSSMIGRIFNGFSDYVIEKPGDWLSNKVTGLWK